LKIKASSYTTRKYFDQSTSPHKGQLYWWPLSSNGGFSERHA